MPPDAFHYERVRRPLTVLVNVFAIDHPITRILLEPQVLLRNQAVFRVCTINLPQPSHVKR